MLHMHVYAATTDARPATVFHTAPEDNEALELCGEWLVPLQCAGLLQATVSLASTPEDVLVRGSARQLVLWCPGHYCSTPSQFHM